MTTTRPRRIAEDFGQGPPSHHGATRLRDHAPAQPGVFTIEAAAYTR